jgi:hypothetical protein
VPVDAHEMTKLSNAIPITTAISFLTDVFIGTSCFLGLKCDEFLKGLIAVYHTIFTAGICHAASMIDGAFSFGRQRHGNRMNLPSCTASGQFTRI